mgnify:CR=1 FL=1
MFNYLKNILLHKGYTTHDRINLRYWFFGFVLFLGVLTGIARMGLADTARGVEEVSGYLWPWALYLFYMSLCCTFFPAPTTWLVLLMASPIIRVFPQSFQAGPFHALETVIIVAAIGALGTTLANLNEYHIFTFLLRFGKTKKFQNTRFYQKACRWFSLSPFTLMTLMSFLPIPVDVVRWLAISNQYRRDHYAYASFAGRFLRYSFIAAAATTLQIGGMGIIAVQGALIGLVLLRYIPKLLAARRAEPGGEPITTLETINE